MTHIIVEFICSRPETGNGDLFTSDIARQATPKSSKRNKQIRALDMHDFQDFIYSINNYNYTRKPDLAAVENSFLFAYNNKFHYSLFIANFLSLFRVKIGIIC